MLLLYNYLNLVRFSFSLPEDVTIQTCHMLHKLIQKTTINYTKLPLRKRGERVANLSPWWHLCVHFLTPCLTASLMVQKILQQQFIIICIGFLFVQLCSWSLKISFIGPKKLPITSHSLNNNVFFFNLFTPSIISIPR